MAYYPKSQIKTNLYTNGIELVYKSNNQSYTGYYFRTSKGKFYTGKSPNEDTPVELKLQPSLDRDGIGTVLSTYPQPTFFNEVLNSPNAIVPLNDAFFGLSPSSPSNYANGVVPRLIPSYHKTKPTLEEIQMGKYNRYFCKKNNELIYIEISKETYTKLINRDPYVAYDLYTPTSILWQNQPTLNFNAVRLIEQDLNWYGFSQYFKGNFEI